MRILHVIYDDIENPWLGGGGAVRTLEIYRRLARNHEITVLTGNFPDSVDEERSGVFYKRVGSGRSYFLSRLSFSLNAIEYIRKMKYDILVEDFSSYSPHFPQLYTKKVIVTSIQNLYSIHALKKYWFGIIPFLLEFGLKTYKNFIVVSSSIMQQLKDRILGEKSRDNKIAVIPNGVDERLFSLETSEKDYVLFLGRIDIYQKGLDILLDAFKKVTSYNKDLNLLIAGSGRDSNKLKGLIKERGLSRVVVLGHVTEERKRDLLANCLMVCMPSRYEAWGIVAIEASACGKPIVGMRIPGVWDAVVDGQTGILVEPENPVKLSEAMMRLLEDKKLRRRLGDNGRRWARRFSWDNVALMQEKFYFECLLKYSPSAN